MGNRSEGSVSGAGSAVPDEAAAWTEELYALARDRLAYGGLDGMLRRPLHREDGSVLPHFGVAASGVEVTDTMGRTFIDWLNGWGPVLLGYRHPAVEEAIRKQFAAGPTISLMHPLEVELADRLCHMVPCAERVAFGKNGSDAVNVAVRVARAATGRDLVLQTGFHGFHEWYTVVHTGVQGIPSVLRSLVEPFPFNDLDALEALFEQHPRKVAAVVMEPATNHVPEPGYLQGVVDLAHRHGSLVIFDEVVTGMRLANGGAQEHYGVTPDLACLGKSMANGLPLAAAVGPVDLMEHLPRVGYGMTFRGETFSLAAASAVFDVLEAEDVCGHLAVMGERLREGYLAAAERQGIDAVLLGPAARMSFDFRDQLGADGSYVRGLFLEEILAQGILTDGNALASYAHTDETVDESITRFERALSALRDRLDRESADPPCPPPRRPRSSPPTRPPLPDRMRRRLRAVRGVRT